MISYEQYAQRLKEVNNFMQAYALNQLCIACKQSLERELLSGKGLEDRDILPLILCWERRIVSTRLLMSKLLREE